jgi:lysophospholipase L1-like esterase
MPAARPLLRVASTFATLILVSVASIAFALQVTPDQSVTVLGQTVAVGATAPSLSTSGPGELVLFGQSLPTRIEFVGPVRPRLVLTRINLDRQITDLFQPGPRPPVATVLGEDLAAGWRRYFVWEAVFVGLGAAVLLGAIAGWRRFDARRTVLTVIAGVLVAESVNTAAVMVTAFTAPSTLRAVDSLTALVGRDEQPLPAPPGPPLPEVDAVVLGDSTAAGVGGPTPPGASEEDRICGRSSFAAAQTLARVNGWRVQNLARGGATIREGILGRQFADGRWLPAQLAQARRAVDADVIVVAVGANDLEWSVLVRACAASEACDDLAQTALFQRALGQLARDYYLLLRQLAGLPGDPLIIVVGYYEPFDAGVVDCVADLGLDREKVQILHARVHALNGVLAEGAATFGHAFVAPDFTGHGICTDQSYIQDLGDPAPLHPNARGQLAIALEVERALLDAPIRIAP